VRTPSGYERLSVLDNVFLLAETPSVHMHVAAIQIFEAGGVPNVDGGIHAEEFKRRVRAVIHLFPRCRQRLRWTPVEHHPVWVDHDGFDLDDHVQIASLPRPGTDAQLKLLCASILETQLDRGRPLWEIWLIEGLARDRFAILCKFHHCMIDGAGGADLMSVLLSPTRDPQTPEPRPYVPRPLPSSWNLLRDSMSRLGDLPFKFAHDVARFAMDTIDIRHDLAMRLVALGRLVGWAMESASDSPLNGILTSHRRFDWLRLSLSDVRAVRSAAGCSLNDVVLAVVAGALRRFLIHRGDAPALDFRISAPVNVRRPGDPDSSANRVSAWILRLPLEDADAKSRLATIHDATRTLKESRSALGVEMMLEAAEWLPPRLLSLGVGLASGPMNMIVTNIPGPRLPLYMLGARLEAIYPFVPLLEQNGLGIALFSYDGSLCWGFTGSYELVPDLRAFVQMVHDSFDELAAAFGVGLSAAEKDGPETSAEICGSSVGVEAR